MFCVTFQGATFAMTDYDGRTALHVACCEGNLECVNFLLNNGAPVHVQDRYGHTPLDDAIRLARNDVIEALVAADAHIRSGPAKVTQMMCK